MRDCQLFEIPMKYHVPHRDLRNENKTIWHEMKRKFRVIARTEGLAVEYAKFRCDSFHSDCPEPPSVIGPIVPVSLDGILWDEYIRSREGEKGRGQEHAVEEEI